MAGIIGFRDPSSTGGWPRLAFFADVLQGVLEVAVDGEARFPELFDDLHPLPVGVMLLCHEKSLRGCAEGEWRRTRLDIRV